MTNVTDLRPIDAPIRPTYGAIRSRYEMWIRDAANDADRTQIDIASKVVTATIKLDTTADVAWTLDAQIEGLNTIEPYRDWLAPVLVQEWLAPDGSLLNVRRQLGLYMVMPSDSTHTRSGSITAVDGRDPTWLLAQQTVRQRMTFGYGVDCADVARALFAGHDTQIRVKVPDSTGIYTGKVRRIAANEIALPAANEVMQAAGYWPFAADETGYISTSAAYRLQQVDPRRAIVSANGDHFDAVTLSPDKTAFKNQVTIQSVDPDATTALKDGYTARADNPADKYSTVNIGTIGYSISDSSDMSLDVLQQQAEILLENRFSQWEQVSLDVIPDPRVTLHECWWLDLRNDQGASIQKPSRWRLISTEFDLAPNAKVRQTATLGRLATLQEIP
jgi:hypothetical protein